MKKTDHITYKDIQNMLKFEIEVKFGQRKAREYSCLDILNRLYKLSGTPNIPQTYMALSDAWDAGYQSKENELKE